MCKQTSIMLLDIPQVFCEDMQIKNADQTPEFNPSHHHDQCSCPKVSSSLQCYLASILFEDTFPPEEDADDPNKYVDS